MLLITIRKKIYNLNNNNQKKKKKKKKNYSLATNLTSKIIKISVLKGNSYSGLGFELTI